MFYKCITKSKMSRECVNVINIFFSAAVNVLYNQYHKIVSLKLKMLRSFHNAIWCIAGIYETENSLILCAY